MTTPQPVGTVKIHNGYVRVVDPDHPLAQGRWVAIHRSTLYDVLGPGDQPCAYCGWVLPWRHEDGYKHCINVDHLNDVKDDNRPENLVPSCWFCNANREWGQEFPDVYHSMIDEVRHVPPWERNPIRLLASRLHSLTTPRKATA